MNPVSQRLDLRLLEQSLARSRAHAQALILNQQVLVDEQVIDKPGRPVKPSSLIRIRGEPDHPYVSRGGVKLAHALDTFGIAVEGRKALDVGASTGGFTDVLLRRGAAHVLAIDVGHGQLAWSIRTDPRVSVREKCNVRTLRPTLELLPIGLIVVDVSFISLRLVLPSLCAFAHAATEGVVLIKPQFELTAALVGRGVVRDPQLQTQAVERVGEAAQKLGITVRALIASPILGACGNREFLAHLGFPPF